MDVPKPHGIKDFIRFHEKQIEVHLKEIKTIEDAKAQDPSHIKQNQNYTKGLEEIIEHHKKRIQFWMRQLKKFSE